MSRLPFDVPIHAAAEHGEVILDGPDGLAASLTPAAAKKSAHELDLAANLAEQKPEAESP